MTNNDIIRKVAEKKLVEEVVSNIVRRPATHPDCQDLSQMIYCILLDYDHDTLERCFLRGEIGRLVARIATRQYWSKTSPFYEQIRRFRELSSQI